jgi:hypothetical protein
MTARERVVLVLLSLLGCGGGQVPGAELQRGAARAVLPYPILITQLPLGSALERQPSASAGMLRAPYGDEGRIILALPDGSTRPLTTAFASACDPEVSRDGKRLLFAARRHAQDAWNIYEMPLGGSDARQVTRGLGDCRSPGYQSTLFTLDAPLPWHQLTFVRVRPGVANECGWGQLANLYSCKPDGSGVRQLTFNLSGDLDPAIMPDGRLLYACWQRCTFDRGVLGRIGLFGVGIDGTDQARYAQDCGRRVQHMPCVTADGRVVFVETDQSPWDGAGYLSMVRARRPLHSYQPISGRGDGLFHSPSALPDRRILVSCRPESGGHHAVYCLDPLAKRLEPVFDDPRYHNLQAKAVYVRPEPDGRSTAVNDRRTSGQLYCLNVYTSDLPAPRRIPPGAARRIRILEGIPTPTPNARAAIDAARAGERGESPASGSSGGHWPPSAIATSPGGIPQLALRRIVGEAAIEPDGSFNLEVPADTPLGLQLVDAQGIALRSCGWIWTKPREPRGCIGCHEDGELTPDNVSATAMTRRPVAVVPPPEERRTIDFRRDLAPLLVQKCLGCHGRVQGSGFEVQRTGDKGGEQQLYDGLLEGVGGDPRNPFGRHVHPGQARTSPLVWHLLGRNTARPWDGAVAGIPAKPIPPSSDPPLTEQDRKLLIEWIDLGARWEGVPRAEKSGGSARPSGVKGT